VPTARLLDVTARTIREEKAMRDTLLLIGNGFAIDYRSHSSEMPNTSRPLDLPLPTPGPVNKPLRETFEELWRVIDALREQQPEAGDFELMEKILLLPKPLLPLHLGGQPIDWEAMRRSHERALIETQLRLHLTHAYTYVTQRINADALKTWRWSSWLIDNLDRLHTAVSFNYDLLLETAMRDVIRIRYLTEMPTLFGIDHELAVFKPHGSINFEFLDTTFRLANREDVYSRKNVFDLINAPVRVLADNELDRQRINSDIVLPTEASRIRQFQYIAPGFRFIKLVRSDLFRCVIVGLSYWHCDRREVNEILSYLRRQTKIAICNPSPTELEAYCEGCFDQVEIVREGLPIS
jgi:hypothetical protein